jgi:hypothetical protein
MNSVYPLNYNKTLVYPLEYNKTLVYPINDINVDLIGNYSLSQKVSLNTVKNCDIELEDDFSDFFECKLGISQDFTT